VFSANPPVAIFSPARRGRDNTTKHTYENVLVVPECVINVVNYSLVQQASVTSAEYPREISEFSKAGLTPEKSLMVKPPRVKESPVQMECRVMSVTPLGSNGGAGNLVQCEVIMMHIDDSILDEHGKIDPVKIDLVARMGGPWYSRAREGLFELHQPAEHVCIGVEHIPGWVRNSKILTGYNIGQLASVFSLPDETDVNEYKLTELADIFITNDKKPRELEQKLQEHAKMLLEVNKTVEAWKTLLAFNH
jgi:flavin reductase (DIM6/NTAB) family NADH-FMN oxidoreductase RutF